MQRKKLTSLPAAQQAELIRQWQTEEASRRTEWAFVRKHAAAIAADQIPWPFDDPTRRKDVIEFMRVTFHLDDPKHCRLSPTDLARYNGALTQATEKGGWWPWHTYGRVVYELTMLPSPLRKYELLPEPAELRLRHVDFSDLPQAYVAHANQKRMKDKLTPLVGKWPEFALELHNDLRMRKFAFTMPPLGPARVSEFKEPVRAFWEKELAPKLSSGEKAMLHTQEGRWPEYSRYFVFLARVHDLIIPDTMLPGSPAKWDSWYNPGYRIPGYPPSRP
jgi:hypothetical protein